MSTSENPVWSVVVPTCNRPALIEKCLSCLAPGLQTIDPERYEVIVTDDSSDDLSLQLVRDKFPWARSIRGPCRGPAANRNHGVAAARGSWIAFTDDDCIPAPGWLAAFDQATWTGLSVYEGKTVCRAAPLTPMQQAPINLSGGALFSCNFAIRAELFRELGGFDENFPFPHLEDTDFHVRVVERDFKIAFVESAMVDHPPRALTPPRRSVRQLESELYYHHVKRGIPMPPGRLLGRFLLTRCRHILMHAFSTDTVRATAAMATELAYLIAALPAMYRKYPFPATSPAPGPPRDE